MTEYIDKQAFKDKYLCTGYLPEMSEEEFDAFPTTTNEYGAMEMKILTELEDINPVEITSHILDGTLMSWLAGWKMKSQMLVAFLLESNRANAQND